jgi:uncharacterized tellurite resistance protein B-like protein
VSLLVGLVVCAGLSWLILRLWRRRRRALPATRTTAPTSHIGAARTPARWIRPAEAIVISDLWIESGLFYFGGFLPRPNGTGNDNAMIDAALPVGPSPGNVSGQDVPYYPSYSAIGPASRRAFLDWLASERDDPQTYIGYVFIYFYGLERRLFLDGARAELETIVAEVTRLLRIYGSNASFKGYALRFLDAASALANTWPSAPWIDPSSRSPELPLRLRGAIGTLLLRKQPLTADWALAWYAGSPEYALRTAAVRCFKEFLALFRIRFGAKYPNGLAVRVPQRTLLGRYSAAGGSFTVDLHGDFETLPDIAGLTAVLRDIDQLVIACSEEIEPYSRRIGRDPSAQGRLGAELLLPKELLQLQRDGSRLEEIRQAIEARVPGNSAMMPLRDLLILLAADPNPGEKLKKREAVDAATTLDHLGFAIEPDPRHGGPTPARDAEVMVFRKHGGTPAAAPSPTFLAARSRVEIAVLVAGVDGKFDAAAAKAIIGEIRATPGLSEEQQARLTGYLGYLVRNPPDARMLNRFRQRSTEERRVLADAAIAMAGADGQISVEEVRVLERTYRSLGLAKEDLYEKLNGLKAATDDEPPSVAPATPARGVAIPPRPTPKAPVTGFKLDMSRIAKIEANTDAVKSILGQVFTDTDDAIEVVPSASPAATGAGGNVPSRFAGLESRHARLLEEIGQRNTIDQSAFAALARKYNLMPAGAIETINDWAFDQYGEAILDDNGEPIAVATHLLAAPLATVRIDGPA